MSVAGHREFLRPEGDIVVGLYDSPSSRAALRWAARHAKATGAPLRAVHVLEWPIGLSEFSLAGPTRELHLPEKVVDTAYRRGMSRVFNDIDPSPTWTLEYAEGAVARVLLCHGERAGLLVIGTREHNAMGSFQSGTISHYCISHATFPVVVVPVEYAEAKQAETAPVPGISDGGRHHDHCCGPSDAGHSSRRDRRETRLAPRFGSARH